MRIPNLSLYLRMVEFEFETEYKFEFETENKIFCEYQPRTETYSAVFVCNGQLYSGSLYKQTMRNSLSRDVHSPVEDTFQGV